MPGTPSLVLNLWGLSRAPTLSIRATRTKDPEGKAVSLPHVSTAGCSRPPPPAPLVGVEKVCPHPGPFPQKSDKPRVRLQCPGDLAPFPATQLLSALTSTLLAVSPEPDYK